MFRAAGFSDLVDYALTRPHPSDLFARVPAEVNAVTGLVGSAGDVERRIKEYTAAGADDIVLVPSATDDDPGRRAHPATGGRDRRPTQLRSRARPPSPRGANAGGRRSTKLITPSWKSTDDSAACSRPSASATDSRNDCS